MVRSFYLRTPLKVQNPSQSQEEYQAQMKEKQIKALKRKARQLGLEVTEKTPAGEATAAAPPVQG